MANQLHFRAGWVEPFGTDRRMLSAGDTSTGGLGQGVFSSQVIIEYEGQLGAFKAGSDKLYLVQSNQSNSLSSNYANLAWMADGTIRACAGNNRKMFSTETFAEGDVVKLRWELTFSSAVSGITDGTQTLHINDLLAATANNAKSDAFNGTNAYFVAGPLNGRENLNNDQYIRRFYINFVDAGYEREYDFDITSGYEVPNIANATVDPIKLFGHNGSNYSVGTDWPNDDSQWVSYNDGSNQVPIANAGTAQTVDVGTEITLDGSGSSDPDLDTLAYTWRIISAPVGSTATLSATNVVNPAFTPDEVGNYEFGLIVNDGTIDSTEATVTHIAEAVITNQPPTPVATLSQSTVDVGTEVTLDGSGSTDPENDTLTYSWSNPYPPSGSTATIQNANSAVATFTPDVEGSYTLTLVVTDSAGNADYTTATLTANSVVVTPTIQAEIKTRIRGVVGTTYPIYSEVVNSTGVVTYNWSTNAGMFSDSTAPEPTITLPNTPQTVTVSLEVTDDNGTSVAVTHDIEVLASIDDLPLANIEILNYEGGFGFKKGDVNGGTMNWAAAAIAHNRLNNSLFVKDRHHKVAEFKLPQLTLSKDITTFHLLDEIDNLQPYIKFRDLLADDGVRSNFKVIGLHHDDDTNRLAVMYSNWYDGNNSDRGNLGIFENPDSLSTSSVSGYYHYKPDQSSDGDGDGYLGVMAKIPEEFRVEFNNSKLSLSGMNNMSIDGRLSWGPSFASLTELPDSAVGVDMPIRAGLGHQTSSLYDVNNTKGVTQVRDYRQNPLRHNKIWSRASTIDFSFIVPNTRTFLCIGKIEGTETGIAYKHQDIGALGSGTHSGFGAVHKDDKFLCYWLYDVKDIMDGYNNVKSIKELMPYDYGLMPYPNHSITHFSHGTYDYVNNLIYMVGGRDEEQSNYDPLPLGTVYKLDYSEQQPQSNPTVKVHGRDTGETGHWLYFVLKTDNYAVTKHTYNCRLISGSAVIEHVSNNLLRVKADIDNTVVFGVTTSDGTNVSPEVTHQIVFNQNTAPFVSAGTDFTVAPSTEFRIGENGSLTHVDPIKPKKNWFQIRGFSTNLPNSSFQDYSDTRVKQEDAPTTPQVLTYQFTATDRAESSTAIQHITIGTPTAPQPPYIVVNHPSSIPIYQYESLPTLDYQAFSDDGTDITNNVVVDTSAVDYNVGGYYDITFNVSDANGSAQQITRQVIVQVREFTTMINSSKELVINADNTLSVDIQDWEPTNTYTYAWSIVSGTATLTNDTSAVATINKSVAGTVVVKCVVTASNGNVQESLISISFVENLSSIPPNAHAGGNQYNINAGQTVTLDGTGSNDPDGTITSYLWEQVSGVNVSLLNSTSSTASFVAPTLQSAGTVGVRLTVTDNDGNTSTDNITVDINPEVVVVDDTTPPVITITGSNPVTITEGQSYTDAGATAIDETDGAVVVTATGAVDTSTVGSYTITYSATDSAGNTSTATRTVNVVAVGVDTTPPNITLNGSNPVTITEGETYVDAGATAVDDTDGSVNVTTDNPVNTGVPDTYTVTYTATDAAGNTATATRTVIVESLADTTAPVITLVPNQTQFTVAVGSTFTAPVGTATDDRDGVWTITPTGTVDTSTEGTSTLTYSAIDSAGNVAQPIVVTVRTVTPPPSEGVVFEFSKMGTEVVPLTLDVSSEPLPNAITLTDLIEPTEIADISGLSGNEIIDGKIFVSQSDTSRDKGVYTFKVDHDPQDRVYYDVVVPSEFLGTDTLVNAYVRLAKGCNLRIEALYIIGNIVRMFVSEGNVGVETIPLTIETSKGSRRERTLKLNVRHK